MKRIRAFANYAGFRGYTLERMPGAHDPSPSTAKGAASACACALPLEPPMEERMRYLAEKLRRLAAPETAVAPPTCEEPKDYGRARLSCLAGTDAKNPFWVVKASDEVVHGHGGFVTNAYADFIRGVVMDAVSRRSVKRPTAS